MRIGTICYATEQGLGRLARSFQEGGVLADNYVVLHPHHPTHREWWPGSGSTPIRPFDYKGALAFCKDLDAALFFETPFDWRLIEGCRKLGVPTAIMPMHECMPAVWPALPDLIVCPSALDQREFRGMETRDMPVIQMTVPVEDRWVAWGRTREKAETFVHNAGHGGLRGRNGTGELLDAWRLVQAPAKLLLRSQKKLEWDVVDPRIFPQVGTLPEEELYREGDVFIFPEKFNGLSLPLQEAFASGMLVMASARFPMTEWLPNGPLVPIAGTMSARVGPPYHPFEEAIVRPEAIAATVEAWHGRPIQALSEQGREWGRKNCWEALRPKWLRLLKALAEGQL